MCEPSLHVPDCDVRNGGIANTICPLMKTFAGLLVYCTIFGFFEGCYVCQVAVITGDIVGIDRMAVAVGILFGIKSIPLTLGPPIAGKSVFIVYIIFILKFLFKYIKMLKKISLLNFLSWYFNN